MIKKTRVVSEFSGCSLPPCYGCRRPQPCEMSPLHNITVDLRSDLTMWTASDFLYVAHLAGPVTKKKNKNCQEVISPALGIFFGYIIYPLPLEAWVATVLEGGYKYAANPHLISWSGERIHYHHVFTSQYPLVSASPVAQLVKNPPAMLETWVWSLDCEDRLEKGRATLPISSILAWRIQWTV